MKIVRDRTITEEVVILDGTQFINCVFLRCQLHYAGTEFLLTDVQMDGNIWNFGGAASRTINLLRKIGVLHGEPHEWIATELNDKN